MLRAGASSSRGAVWVASAALAAVFTGCASQVGFLNLTPGTPLEITGTLRRPPGPGRLPAVVILHGCAGLTPMHDTWSRWFTEWGYLALAVDSWRPRGLRELCSRHAPDVPNTARFDDAMGALHYLQGRPDVRPDRVGVMGFSNGGVFSIAVINGPSLERARARGVRLPSPGFVAGVGVYPGGCESLLQDLVVAPLLVLTGGADDWTPPEPCVEMVRNMRARGADAAIVVYTGAYHYFDVEGQRLTFLPDVENSNKPDRCCGATVAYDAAAAADARERVRQFFARHLAP